MHTQQVSDATITISIRDQMEFLRIKAEYYSAVESEQETPLRPDLFEQLATNGIVIVPDFFPVSVIAKMRTAIPPRDQFLESPEGDRALFFPDAFKVAALSPFFGNHVISNLARSYISSSAVSSRTTVGVKEVIGEFVTFETFFHMDTWKHRLKAWCYLTDVGPNQAPMIYLKGSHTGAWRTQIEAEIAELYRTTNAGFATEESYFLGCLWPHQVALLKERYGFEEVVCTGGAGTVVMFDGRGLHKASSLKEGRRELLLSYWVHPA